MISNKEELKKCPKAVVYVREMGQGNKLHYWKRKYNGVVVQDGGSHVLFIDRDDKVLDGEWLPKTSKRMRVEISQ